MSNKGINHNCHIKCTYVDGILRIIIRQNQYFVKFNILIRIAKQHTQIVSPERFLFTFNDKSVYVYLPL